MYVVGFSHSSDYNYSTILYMKYYTIVSSCVYKITSTQYEVLFELRLLTQMLNLVPIERDTLILADPFTICNTDIHLK